MTSIQNGFLNGTLQDLYRLNPGDLKGAMSTPSSVDRAALVYALERYHTDLGTLGEREGKKLSPRAATLKSQLERLSHPNARVVVAGQQAGLLGGPAFCIHKAVDAILLARKLDSEEVPVLPIFWVASQDHDALEVKSTSLLDLDERSFHLTVALPQGVPIGNIALEPAWVESITHELEDFNAPEPHKRGVLERIKKAADGAKTYADWFSRLIHDLLAESGLIVLDPMHPDLAALFKPALSRELQNPLAGPELIEKAALNLLERGYTPALRRPEGSTNLFLTGDDGQRRLLRLEKKTFYADTAYSKEELEAILETDPRRITPAAGLRPVIQDTVLPTVAVVLGPGELAYATQLLGLYGLHALEQPLLWPRLKVTWLEPPIARILKKYGLSAAEFQADPKGSLERILLERSGTAEKFRIHLERFEESFAEMLEQIGKLDPTLENPILKAQSQAKSTVGRLEQKLGRALYVRENEAEGQFNRLERHLLPLGQPQEREMNFFSLLMKHGPVVLERLLAQSAGANVELELV